MTWMNSNHELHVCKGKFSPMVLFAFQTRCSAKSGCKEWGPQRLQFGAYRSAWLESCWSVITSNLAEDRSGPGMCQVTVSWHSPLKNLHTGQHCLLRSWAMNLSVHHMLLFAFKYTAYSTSLCGTHRYSAYYCYSPFWTLIIGDQSSAWIRHRPKSVEDSNHTSWIPSVHTTVQAEHSKRMLYTAIAVCRLLAVVTSQLSTWCSSGGRGAALWSVCKDTSLNRTAISPPGEAPAWYTVPISQGGDTWQQQQEQGAAMQSLCSTSPTPLCSAPRVSGQSPHTAIVLWANPYPAEVAMWSCTWEMGLGVKQHGCEGIVGECRQLEWCTVICTC